MVALKVELMALMMERLLVELMVNLWVLMSVASLGLVLQRLEMMLASLLAVHWADLLVQHLVVKMV